MRIHGIAVTFVFVFAYIRIAISYKRRSVSCENEVLSISCSSTSEKLLITESNFGRQDNHTCAVSNVTTCVSASTQSIISSLCDGFRGCSLKVTANNFEDSCPSVPKYLYVEYDCVNITTQGTSFTTSSENGFQTSELDRTETTTLDQSTISLVSNQSENQRTDIITGQTTEGTTNKLFCPCNCVSRIEFKDYVKILADPILLQELTSNITERLKVDKAELSSSKRRKQSVSDDRPSATYVGFIGVTVLTVVFGSLVACDISNVILKTKQKPGKFEL